MMIELNNTPKNNLDHLTKDTSRKSSVDKKAATIKWISIIAYLGILIGSLFTF